MVDLKPESNPTPESPETPKKLVLGEIKNEVPAEEAKITDSPRKRWKIFAMIGGIVALVIGISVATNWDYISKNFRGFTLIELETKPKPKQEALNLPPGTIVYDAYQAEDGSVYLKVPYWNCKAGEEPDKNKPGKAGSPGKCKSFSVNYSDHDYSIYLQPGQYWDCPAGFEKEGPGECSKHPKKGEGGASLIEGVIVGTTKAPVEAGAEGDCPEGTIKLPKANLQYICMPIDDGEPTAAEDPNSAEADDKSEAKPGSGKSKACASLEATLKSYENALSPANSKGKRPIEIEMLEFLFTKVLQEGLENDCNVDEDYRNAAKCSNEESFDKKTEACKSAPGFTNVHGNNGEYDCSELGAAIKLIDQKLAKHDLSKIEEAALKNLKANLSKGKTSCPAKSSAAGTDGGAKQDPAAAEEESCPAGTFYDDVKKACMSNLVLACPSLDAKIKTYEDALLPANTKNKNAIEIEILEFLLTKAVQEAQENDCSIDSDYKDAEKCNNQESFDKKTEACKSAPGYEKIGDNQDEYDCDEIESAMAAIDLKLVEDDLNNIEKAALASLKLNLVTGKNTSCKASDNGGGSNGGGGGGSSKSGGGGGGSAKSTNKTFEIKNVQVKPEEFNPFTENVKVYFFISHDAYVALQVLDGKEVIHTVKEEKMNAGDRSFSWDGKKDQGGFASEKKYTFKIIAKKANNKANKIEEETDVTVKYFDASVDLPEDPSFEGDSGTVKFSSTNGSGSGTGSGSGAASGNGAGSGSNGAANYAQSHASASPLAQKIYAEGKGKTKTSETGPADYAYLLLIVLSVSAVLYRKPSN